MVWDKETKNAYYRDYYRKNAEKMRASSKRFHEANREKVREWQKAGNARRRASMKRFLDAVKSCGCVDCGYDENTDALQFDHVLPKNRNIGMYSSIKSVVPELEKCEVRCANCHAIVTAQRRREAEANGE